MNHSIFNTVLIIKSLKIAKTKFIDQSVPSIKDYDKKCAKGSFASDLCFTVNTFKTTQANIHAKNLWFNAICGLKLKVIIL